MTFSIVTVGVRVASIVAWMTVDVSVEEPLVFRTKIVVIMMWIVCSMLKIVVSMIVNIVFIMRIVFYMW